MPWLQTWATSHQGYQTFLGQPYFCCLFDIFYLISMKGFCNLIFMLDSQGHKFIQLFSQDFYFFNMFNVFQNIFHVIIVKYCDVPGSTCLSKTGPVYGLSSKSSQAVKDPWPRVLSLSGARVVGLRPHLAGTWQYIHDIIPHFRYQKLNINWENTDNLLRSILTTRGPYYFHDGFDAV